MTYSIYQQAQQLVTDIDTLFHTTQHLDDKFHSKIEKMSRKMREFVVSYQTYSQLSLGEYLSYLNHDALSPLTIVLGYAELFRSVNAHVLSLDELNQMSSIADGIRYLTECIHGERNSMVEKRDKSISI